MYSLKRIIYAHSPSLVKRGIGRVPFHWLAGRAYRQVRRRDSWIAQASADELLAYQRRLLRTSLVRATSNVPAYLPLRQLVQELPPEEALAHFPLLDKQSLKSNFDAYRSRDMARHRTWTSTTGGTTGDQLHFVLDDGAQSREIAFIHRLWKQVGYTPKSRKATFRGVEFRSLPDACYWQDNPIYNECQFSPFHISRKTFPAYLQQLRTYQPDYIHGYPSAVALIAELLLDHREAVPVKAVLLGSESVTPEQRRQISAGFASQILSWYGHSERVILAGECEKSDAYHCVPDYGWVEIVDDEGRAVPEGESGELVGTGFWNAAMPLIRYRTGDRARKLPCRCSCGRGYLRFDRVEGRWKQEYVIGRTGALISVAALNMHGPFYDNVLRYQYFQDTPGRLEVRVLPNAGFGDREAVALQQAFQRRTNDELSVDVVVVTDIPLTPRGKLRRLIQKIPPSLSSSRVTIAPQDVDSL